MASIEERLQRVEDELAIVDRVNAFAATIDNKELDAWLDCFTEDGRWSWRETAAAAPAFAVAGRAQLAEWVAGHRRRFPPGEEHHVVTNPRVVEVDGDSARAESWYVVVRSEGDPRLGVRSTGRYHDRLRREADGAWRIAEREAVGEMPRVE
jgi:3-phenylpropionate/cinnamic acid dioxygenase small subunit